MEKKRVIIPLLALFFIASWTFYLSHKGPLPIQLELADLLTSNNSDVSKHPDPHHWNLHSKDIPSLQQFFHGLLTVDKSVCSEFKRFGREGDGGYQVCMREPFIPKPKSCLVYSFGINNDWSFDEDFSNYGCAVHSFDPSIHQLDHIHPPNISFHNLGLWDRDFVNKAGWSMKSLSSIINQLKHDKISIDVLKSDVEGAEWPLIRDLTSSEFSIRQLVIEIHTPRMHPERMTKLDYIEIIRYVQRLKDKGYILVKNVQRNYCCGRFAPLMPRGVTEKCCYELFFVNSMFLPDNHRQKNETVAINI
jgi:hypothetical protein